MTAVTMDPQTSASTRPVVGALYLVSTRSTGGELFLGRACSDQEDGRLTLEGKSIGAFVGGVLSIPPFATRASFPFDDPRFALERLDHPDAIDEATRLLTLASPEASWTSFPLLVRWFHASFGEPAPHAGTSLAHTGAAGLHLDAGFRATAASFRRALIRSPQVATARELDKLVELEADLAIELGKCANAAAANLNGILARENELSHFLDHLGTRPFAGSTEMGGWTLVSGRIQAAKAWALRHSNTALVRELATLLRDGFRKLSDIVLEHESALETLVSETLGSYGIELDTTPDPVTAPLARAGAAAQA